MVNYKISYMPKRSDYLGIVLILAGFFADIGTKLLASSIATGKDIIPGILKFSVVKNTGLAFSMLKSQPYAALALNAIVFILLVVIWWKLGLTFLAISIGGAAGNLIERIVTGGVTDFISVLQFPIFNVGDSLIFIGIALTIIFHGRKMSPNSPIQGIQGQTIRETQIIRK